MDSIGFYFERPASFLGDDLFLYTTMLLAIVAILLGGGLCYLCCSVPNRSAIGSEKASPIKTDMPLLYPAPALAGSRKVMNVDDSKTIEFMAHVDQPSNIDGNPRVSMADFLVSINLAGKYSASF